MKCPIYDIVNYEMSFYEISFYEMSFYEMSLKCPNAVITSLELTGINPDRHIFSIKCGTNIYFIYSLIWVWSIKHH